MLITTFIAGARAQRSQTRTFSLSPASVPVAACADGANVRQQHRKVMPMAAGLRDPFAPSAQAATGTLAGDKENVREMLAPLRTGTGDKCRDQHGSLQILRVGYAARPLPRSGIPGCKLKGRAKKVRSAHRSISRRTVVAPFRQKVQAGSETFANRPALRVFV